MSCSISKLQELNLDYCKYLVTIKFSCYDALTAKNLKVDTISINEKTIYDVELEKNPANVVINSTGGQYSYDVEINTVLSFVIKIEKNNYFPFTSLINLSDYKAEKGFSVFDTIPIVIDLGKFPLLSLYKTNAIVLAWNEYPYDLDAYLTNPDESETYYEKPYGYFSNVDIDDKVSYGPETISVTHWTNLANEHAINTTFKYDVNWYKDGKSDVNSINANVSLFVDPENIRTIKFPAEYDTINRSGKNWHVFELDVVSVYDTQEIDENAFIKSTFVNDNFESNLDVFTNFEEYESLDHYYYKLFKNFDFVIDIVDSSNKSVTSSFTIEKIALNDNRNSNKSFYSFATTLSSSKANNCKINFYLSDSFKEKNIIYYSESYKNLNSGYYYNENGEHISKNKCISASNIFRDKYVPFKMIAYNDEEIKNVKYRWDLHNNRLYIEILNRKYSLKEVKSFEYYLGVEHTVKYDTLYDQNNVLCKHPNDLYWYFYSYKNYFDQAKFYKNDDSIKLLSEIYLKNIGNYNDGYKNFYFDDPSIFNVYAVPYSEFSRNFDLTTNSNNIKDDTEHYHEYYVKSTIKNVSTNQCFLKFDDLIIDDIYDSYDGKNNVKSDVSKIKDTILIDIKKGLIVDKHYKIDNIYKHGTNKAITDFTFQWKNDGLIISFNETYSKESFDIIFKYISVIFSKKELNYGLDEAGNEIEVYPSVFISENGNEYNCLTYYSIWYPLELKLLFKDDLVDNANYSITIVDYLKIYKFNVYELNYFDKNYKVTFDILNYDDYVSGDIVSRQKLGNITFNFSGRDCRKGGDNFNLVYGRSEPTDSSEKYITNYEYNLNNAGIRCDWDYLASFKTLYSHKGFYEHIKLYDETPKNCTHVDGSNNEEKQYILQYPLVNFYGWFTDSLGNTIRKFIDPDEIFWSDYYGRPSYGNYEIGRLFHLIMTNEQRKVRVKLVNCDEKLSSTLTYDYALNYYYTYNNDGSVNEKQHHRSYYDEYPCCWNEEYTNMFSFFFKQKFNNDSSFPDNDFDVSCSRQNRYAIYPGFYNMYVYLGDKLISTYERLDLTKDAESKGLTYNKKFIFPLVNFTGCIKNLNTGEREYRNGVVVELINNEYNYQEIGEGEKYLVKSSSFHIATINGREYRKVNSGYALVGCCYPLSKYLCPILVGRSAEAVICDQGSRQYLKFEYKGETWYCNRDDWGFHYAYPSYNYTDVLLNSIEEVEQSGSNDGTEYWISMAKKFIDMYFELSPVFPYDNDENINTFTFTTIEEAERDEDDNYYTSCEGSYYTKNWTNFNFVFQGFNIDDSYYEYDDMVFNASPGIKPGNYTLKVKYKDEIFYKDENFVISHENQNELYDYVIEFPLCSFKGQIFTNSELIYGNDWHVIFENINDSSKSRTFDYDRFNYKDNFEFRGFGRYRNIDGEKCGSKHEFFSDYFSPGLYEGTYKIIFKYKENVMKTFDNFVISKADEAAGKYNNYKFDIGDIYINLSGRFIDSQFNNLIRRRSLIRICEENFDGNIQDETFDNYNLESEINHNSKYIYRFDNLFKNGYYGVNIITDRTDSGNSRHYHYWSEHGNFDSDNYCLPILGIVKSNKTFDQIEGNNSTYPSSYFDSYTSLQSTNIYYPSGTVHSTANLIKLRDAISENGLATYDIYLKYSFVWFTYRLYYKFKESIGLKIPITVTLSNNSLGINEQPNVVNDYTSEYFKTSLVKSGNYNVNIVLRDFKNITLFNKQYEASQRTYYDINEIALDNNMKEFQAIVVTKYYSNNDDNCKYQVIPFNSNGNTNTFTFDLIYNNAKSTDESTWKHYYSYNSNNGSDCNYLDSYPVSSYVYATSGENDTLETNTFLLRYTVNTVGLDQLHKDIFIKFENAKINGYDVDIKGIYNDDNNFASLIYPQFYNEESDKFELNGHISELFFNNYNGESDTNYLRRYILSGDFNNSSSNNLLDSNSIFDVSKFNTTHPIKIIHLEKIKINIHGKIYNNSFKDVLTFGDAMSLYVEVYYYDKQTKTKTLVRTFYYDNSNDYTFILDGLDAGLYTFRFFLNNIELYEAERGKIHEFNYNDYNYSINLEKEFPTLSGNLYLKYDQGEPHVNAIDNVFVDIISNDLNGTSYYGLNINFDGDYYYNMVDSFIQNSSWPNSDNGNFGKINWPNVLEGNYTIKYFMAPTIYYAPYGRAVSCHYANSSNGRYWADYEDSIDSHHFICSTKKNNRLNIYNNVLNCLSGENKTFEISVDDLYNFYDDYYPLFSNVSNYQKQFLNSKTFRICRIVCKINYFEKDERYAFKTSYSILKFTDVFPSGTFTSNLNNGKNIQITLNSNIDDIIAKKADNFNYDRYEIESVYISFGDLVATDTLKVESNTQTLSKDFNYMYIGVLILKCEGYRYEQHMNENVKSNLFDSSGNSYGTYNDLNGPNSFVGRCSEDKCYENYYFGLRTDDVYNATYFRNNFELGNKTNMKFHTRCPYFVITCKNLNTLTGSFVNKSVEDCKKSFITTLTTYEKQNISTYIPHHITSRIFYMGDKNGNNGDIGYYYDQTNDKNHCDFEYGSLLAERNDLICMIHYSGDSMGSDEFFYEWVENNENDPVRNPVLSVIFDKAGQTINKNIELPYIKFKISFEYIRKKDNVSTSCPEGSTLTIKRNQKEINSGDTFDEVYDIGTKSSVIVKSGYYDQIKFIIGTGNDQVVYNYNPTFINSNRTFKLYYACEQKAASVVVRKNGTPQPNCKIFRYDENENLLDIITTNSNGVSDGIVFNIDVPYKFKAIDESYDFKDVKVGTSTSEIIISY